MRLNNSNYVDILSRLLNFYSKYGLFIFNNSKYINRTKITKRKSNLKS